MTIDSARPTPEAQLQSFYDGLNRRIRSSFDRFRLPFALSLSKGLTEWRLVFATSALYGRARPVTFGIAPKVTKNASPCTPLLPAVLATGGMRRTARESFADATHSVCRRRIYDRPLLRSSARAEGADFLIQRESLIGFQKRELMKHIFAPHVLLRLPKQLRHYKICCQRSNFPKALLAVQ